MTPPGGTHRLFGEKRDGENEVVVSGQQGIRRFSTEKIPAGMRLDYWMSHLGESLWPVSDWSGISGDFSIEMQEAPLGCLSTVTETLSGVSRTRRTKSDVANSTESCYQLFTCDAPWSMAQSGHDERLLGGDVVLVGDGEHDSYTPPRLQSHIIKLPTHWLQSWLADPDVLVGRRIARDSRWGRVLSPMVTQLTPELAVAPPLPHRVLVDQLGTTLALIAGEAQTGAMPDLLQQIRGCIGQRCCEAQLTAADVAASLNVPPSMLHRVLAANNLTFASELIDARFQVALHMLTSPSYAQLTSIDIARRAGFLNTSHFARVVRKRTGHTPQALRRSAS